MSLNLLKSEISLLPALQSRNFYFKGQTAVSLECKPEENVPVSVTGGSSGAGYLALSGNYLLAIETGALSLSLG